MTTEEKKRLIDLLTESQSANRAIVQEIDPDMRVYKDPDWRVRDILGHLATWDRQVTRSLQECNLPEFTRVYSWVINLLDKD